MMEALEAATRIADRLTDPAAVRAVVTSPDNVARTGDIPWDTRSLSHGLPATILLFGELDRILPGQGWGTAAGEHIRVLAEDIERRGMHSGTLHGGVTGVAFAVWSVSNGGTRFPRLLRSLEAAVVSWGQRMLDANDAASGGADMGGYDVIAGAAGLARYLLLRRGQPELEELLGRCLASLAALADPVVVNGARVPGWYVPAERQFTAADRIGYPNGNFNLGMAHGIAGVVAALALASLGGAGAGAQAGAQAGAPAGAQAGVQAGVQAEAMTGAMRCMADWIVAQRQDDSEGPVWPGRLALEHLAEPSRSPADPRPSWCYGAPGIARALYLAGQALKDRELAAFATEAFAAGSRRPRASRGPCPPGLCHGTAGLLRMTARMARDTGDGEFDAGAKELAADLAGRFDPAAPFGFRDVIDTGGTLRLSDKAGLLDGAAGVALGLASADAARPAIWDTALLIA